MFETYYLKNECDKSSIFLQPRVRDNIYMKPGQNRRGFIE